MPKHDKKDEKNIKIVETKSEHVTNDNGEKDASSYVNKIDSVDQSEMPSKTKLKSIISNKGKHGKEELEEKKIGFIGLTAKYWIKEWKTSLIILLFVLISSAAIAMGPWIIKNMTSAITSQNDIWNMDWHNYMYIQIGLFVIIGISTFIANMMAGFLGKAIEIDLRNKTIEKLIVQDMSFYSDKKIGDILTKVVSDTQIIGDQSQSIPPAFLSAVFTTIFSLISMFIIDWKIAFIAVGLFLLILLLVAVSFGGLRGLMFKVRDAITRINGTVINRISTVQLIKTSGTEDYEKRLFKKLHIEYEEKYAKMITFQSAIIMILIVGISSIQAILTIAMAGVYHNDKATLIDLLPSFILAAGIMVGPIMQVVRVIAGMVIASTASERVVNILDSKPRLNQHLKEGEGIYIDKIEGDIIFDGVTFAYPEKPDKVILPTFDFKFEQGKTYAFVGETGAGKSTISKLLLRFYDPTYGRVMINGDINLKDIHLSSYLSKVGYVEQEPQILLGNIFENVKYGTEGKTDEQVIEACKKAELDKIINTWPNGYNTILGERGFMLSGGQKQRLVIARMFLKDPELLILDEATSALDNIVEKEIQEKLNELMKDRTTVSIAHRLSTIKNADEIIVLAPGKGAIQKGTFNELKKQPGHFKNLYEAGAMK